MSLLFKIYSLVEVIYLHSLNTPLFIGRLRFLKNHKGGIKNQDFLVKMRGENPYRGVVYRKGEAMFSINDVWIL